MEKLKELRERYNHAPTAELKSEIQRRQRAMLFRALAKLADNNGKNQFAVAAELADKFILLDIMPEDDHYYIPYGVLKPCWSGSGVKRLVQFN